MKSYSNLKDLPLCKCGLPCDIKKNMWNKLREEFDIDDEPCNFFMEYTKDKQLKLNENKQFEDKNKNLKELFKKSYW